MIRAHHLTGASTILKVVGSPKDFSNTFPFFFLGTLVSTKGARVGEIFIFLLPLLLDRLNLEVEAVGGEIGFLGFDLLGLLEEEPSSTFARISLDSHSSTICSTGCLIGIFSFLKMKTS